MQRPLIGVPVAVTCGVLCLIRGVEWRLCTQRVTLVAATAHAAHFYLFARLEYQHVGHQVVEYTRDEQGGEITVDYIPLEYLLEDEKEYHLDQEINDRGIGLDMMLVEQAISIDSISRKNLTQQIQNLTDLDNPNSVA